MIPPFLPEFTSIDIQKRPGRLSSARAQMPARYHLAFYSGPVTMPTATSYSVQRQGSRTTSWMLPAAFHPTRLSLRKQANRFRSLPFMNLSHHTIEM